MNRKYTIIAIMCSCWLSAAGSSSDRATISPVAAHEVPAIEAEIAAVEEETDEHRAERQAAEARAEGLRAEAVKAEVIDRLRESGNRYEEVAVRMAASGREIGHITINHEGMPTYEGRQLIIFRGSVPLMTENGNGLKIATLLLRGTTAPINDLREIMDGREFITGEVSVALKDIPEYSSVTHEELFIILLLLQINDFRPCQGLVKDYPTDHKGDYDDFWLNRNLKKYGVKSDHIQRLTKEAAEVAHRNGRSLNIGETNFVLFLSSLYMHEGAFEGEERRLQTNRKRIRYIEELKELNAFAPRDEDDLLIFMP